MALAGCDDIFLSTKTVRTSVRQLTLAHADSKGTFTMDVTHVAKVDPSAPMASQLENILSENTATV